MIDHCGIFGNTFYCTNFMFLHKIFEVFQLTFSFFHQNVNRYTFTWYFKAMVTQFNVYTWVYTCIYKDIISGKFV